MQTPVVSEDPVPHPIIKAVDPWRQLIVSPWSWRSCPNQAGALVHIPTGEAGGFFVECEALGGRRAYLKPLRRPNHTGQVRAAREKIVSDLAHDLEVPVPAVLLYDRGGSVGADEEQYACLSRVMFPRQWAWGQVKQLIVASENNRATEAVMAALPGDAARGFALDAWVAQPDHNDHPHNIVFGYVPSATPDGRLIFLDYAWALGYHPTNPTFRWEGDGWKTTDAPPFPPHMVRFLDRSVLKETVERIEAMKEETIREVVDRIPAPFLPEDQRRVIVAGLLGRQTMVRQIVSKYLPTS